MRLLYIIHKLFFSVNEMMKIPMQTFMCVYTYVVLRTKHPFHFSVTMLTNLLQFTYCMSKSYARGYFTSGIKEQKLY